MKAVALAAAITLMCVLTEPALAAPWHPATRKEKLGITETLGPWWCRESKETPCTVVLRLVRVASSHGRTLAGALVGDTRQAVPALLARLPNRWALLGADRLACQTATKAHVQFLLARGCGATAASTWPTALTTTAIEHYYEQFGIYQDTPTRRHYKVLVISCSGQGFPGPDQPDDAGIPEPTYSKFLCDVTSRPAMPGVGLIHVDLTPSGPSWESAG